MARLILAYRATANDVIRNVAVIAHVDHGKTTLVDQLLKQSGTLKDARNRVMDNRAQEKERGITILAKNTALQFEDGRRINIVDTPGHLDFSGEVERALQMVEGFILLVDAYEGVRPGTRYVLRKALQLNLKPIVVLNKIDKDDSRIEKAVSEVQDLFLDTAQNPDQLDICFMYGSGRDGYINDEPLKSGTLEPLFKKIFSHVPAPNQKDERKLQMLVGQLNESSQGLKQAIGRIFCGSVSIGDVINVVTGASTPVRAQVKELTVFRGVDKVPVPTANFGEIVCITLTELPGSPVNLVIGSTICHETQIEPWPYKPPDDPTFSLILHENQSSWKEKEIKNVKQGYLTELTARLHREAMVNTALKIVDEGGKLRLMGRGPLHISVILEEMRREGYEFELEAPEVIKKVIDGVVHEPFERLTLEYRQTQTAEVVSLLSSRHAEVGEMTEVANNRIVIEAVMPVRLMTDLPNRFHQLTKGEGVLNHIFDSYRPEAAAVTERDAGCLCAIEGGEVQAYALTQLQQTGRFFVLPGDFVHYGQIVGENITGVHGQDMAVNVTKRNEQLGGMRANASDASQKTKSSYTAQEFNLENCMAWVNPGETIVVTPKSVRMRKPKFNGKTTMRHSTKK